MRGILYLIPTSITECDDPFLFMPVYNKEIIASLDNFIVEELRTARRFISKCKIDKAIDSLSFIELNEHTADINIEAMMKPLMEGKNIGVMSEAGVPGVADPGSVIVAKAHLNGIKVIPLIGPSSILLSLMASGMNGQSFCFNGYLPIKSAEKLKRLKELERKAITQHQTQIFIEAPYRNDKLFEDMLTTLSSQTKLCVASNINAKDEYIKTFTVETWKKTLFPPIKKVPTIFLIG